MASARTVTLRRRAADLSLAAVALPGGSVMVAGSR
jgi:hypothetical protein